ncbi:MAG: molybdopterin-binding protein, partial [Acidobacteriota bacterium]
MRAEIIAVGSELLTPDSIDSNSLYITQVLNDAGCAVHLKTIVGDSQSDIEGVLLQALQRSDLILFTGGLGPTMDDRTRDAVAAVLKRPLVRHNNLLEELRRKFASRGFKMSKNNERQAETRLAHRSFYITGMTESELDSQLAPIYTAYPRVNTTILAGTKHIAVRLYRWIQTESDTDELDILAARIQETIGAAIFSTRNESIEEVVGRMLRESGNTLAVAESCTGGMLGMYITRVPGSSDYFMGGIQCYSDRAKAELCG